MKNLKTILGLFLLIAGIFPAFSANIDDKFKDSHFRYSIINEENKEVAIVGYISFEDGNVIIPETVNYDGETYTVTRIGERAFNGCISLNSVEIGNSVQTIGDWAFQGCTSLESIVMGYSVQTLGECAFQKCISLESVIIEKSVQTIGWYAFSGCSSLKNVEIGNSVQAIENFAFEKCTSLESVAMGNSVQTIGAFAFQGCTSLESILMGNSVQTVGNYAFTGCTSLESAVIANSVQTIGNFAFENCTSLVCVEMGNSVQTIGTYAFANCSLDNLEIPASVSTIGEKAFSGNNLSFLSLPKTLEKIGESAFAGNPIEKVYVHTNASLSGILPYSNLVEVIFDEDAVTVPNFCGAPVLKDVTLPPLMKSLPAGSLSNCPSLQNVFFYDNIESIGNSAFSGCVSLKELNLPSSIREIGDAAFMDCRALEKMKIPGNITVIPQSLFSGCESLEKVYFSESVSSFGSSAFQNCTSLRSLIIPEGVKSVPAYMLQGCTSISEILIPNTVTSIGDHAFSDCASLKNVDLGPKIYEIGNYAFDGCTNLKAIHSMALNPPYAEMYTFPIEAYENVTITVQEQSLERYNQQNPWYRFMNYLTVDGAVCLSHYNVNMAGDEVFQLGVYGANGKIVWTSSNPSVAYANECGLIVAMGITGSTVITANVDGKKINCNVVVSTPKRNVKGVTTIAANGEEYTEPVDIIIESIDGNPPMVNARLIPVGSCTVIDWTSSDNTVASVENGIVKVLGEGEVEFGAETENGLGESYEADTSDILPGTTHIFDIVQSGITKATNDVYDLTGRVILLNVTEEEIYKLNPGIYLIKGKKVLVK